ncbi:heparinase II/III domain-containing protein, partial [Magnetococcales bacterium HHB-1]
LVHQVGDNDNGRFLRWLPDGEWLYGRTLKQWFKQKRELSETHNDKIFWQENHLTHHELISVITTLFNQNKPPSTQESPATAIARTLAQSPLNATWKNNDLPKEIITHNSRTTPQSWIDHLTEKKYQHIQRRLFIPQRHRKRLQQVAYHDFGLYIFRSDHFYMAIRLGLPGQKGNGGHGHRDQLALELNVRGLDIIADPGTYLYTSAPKLRNLYRSPQAHFISYPKNWPQENPPPWLFQLRDQVEPKVHYFGALGFVGEHHAFGHPLTRIITLDHPEMIMVHDYLPPHSDTVPRLQGPHLFQQETEAPFSPGYGLQMHR